MSLPGNQPDKVLVTLHVFSGRPDPTWELERSSPAYLHVRTILQTHNSTQLPERLGYTGFTVGLLQAPEEEHLTIARGSARDTELLLLDHVRTRPPRGHAHPLPDSVVHSVRTDIQNIH